jgi:nucleoside phosphorylase
MSASKRAAATNWYRTIVARLQRAAYIHPHRFVPQPSRAGDRSRCPYRIVTALDLETEAVLRHLGNDRTEEVDPNGTVYYRGTFEDYDVVVVEAGAGNTSTAVLTAVAAAHLRPEVSLFVGVGGGVKDVKLGDVVVATKVYGYEVGKATGGGFLPRADVGRGAHALTRALSCWRRSFERCRR